MSILFRKYVPFKLPQFKITYFLDREGNGRMKKAQVSVPVMRIKPAYPFVRDGSLGRSASRLTKT